MKQTYLVLDLLVKIETDCRDFLERFHLDYELFQTNVTCDADLVIVAHFTKGVLKANGQDFCLENHPRPIAYAFHLTVQQIFCRLENYCLIHAAVLSYQNTAWIIGGPSGAGKTTIVSKITNNNILTLGDDVCAIHKKTGLVHPFLRSSWRYPSTDATKKVPVKPKYFAEQPASPRGVICLQTVHQNNNRSILLEVKNGKVLQAPDLLKEIKLKKLRENVYLLEYQYSQKREKWLRSWLEKNKQHFWRVRRKDQWSYQDSPPSLEPITPHEAALQFAGESKQEGPSPFVFFLQMIELFDKIECYTMTVGKLENIVTLIRNKVTQTQNLSE